MSVETGIAPQDLIDAPDGVLEAMLDYMKRRAEERKKKSR